MNLYNAYSLVLYYADIVIIFILWLVVNSFVTDEQERQRLIDCFVNAVFVYDDKIVLTFNYKDGTKTVSLADVNGSDLEDTSPPKKFRFSAESRNFFCNVGVGIWIRARSEF